MLMREIDSDLEVVVRDRRGRRCRASRQNAACIIMICPPRVFSPLLLFFFEFSQQQRTTSVPVRDHQPTLLLQERPPCSQPARGPSIDRGAGQGRFLQGEGEEVGLCMKYRAVSQMTRILRGVIVLYQHEEEGTGRTSVSFPEGQTVVLVILARWDCVKWEE